AHPKNQSVVLNRLPGSAKATCTPVGDRRDVRSGSVAAGNFVQARGAYKKAAAHREVPTVFMYVIPQHNKGLEHATVTMKPVDADGEARTVRSNDVEQANVWKYFAFQLPVPAAGTWQLHMSSGDDRGCFEVNFTKQ
ncbi:MAG: hypothetical protein ACRDP4_13130, partial [Nocardioidaceae bacterium]